jgi:ribosomal protein L12E/L44/L45/RPP1/RPP2
MSWKKTLGFVIVAALLGGYYYWYEMKGGEQRKAAEEAAQRIFQLKKEAIETVTLKHQKDLIRLVKEPTEGWLLVEPVRAKAEQRTVDEVLDGLVEGQRDKVIAEQASNLADFGLHEPGIVVEATVKDVATPTVLQIGARTPTLSGYYAREGEQSKVLMIPTSLQTKFDKTVFNLRDKAVLSLDQNQVKRLEVHQGDQLIAVEAAGDKGWQMVVPLNAKADKTKVTDLISAINGAKVKEFIDETPQDLAQYGLHPPKWRLTFFIGDDRAEKRLLIGDEDTAKGGLNAKRGTTDNVFLIETKLSEKLPQAASEWRDRKLLAFEREKVDRVEILAGGSTTEVVCVDNCGKIPDDRWQLKQPLKAKADAIKVRTLLRNVEELKVKDFVSEAATDLAPYGLAPPSAQVRIWLRETPEPISVLVGRDDPEKEGVYVTVPDKAAVYLIETKDRLDIVKQASELRDLKLLAFKARDVRKIELQHPDRQVEIEGDGENWSQVKPEKAKLDGYKVRSLLWKLEDLEFQEEWLATAVASEAHGLDAPTAALTLWVEGGKKVDTLKLGKRVEGKEWIYAQLESTPMLYAVDAKILDDLPKGTGDI